MDGGCNLVCSFQSYLVIIKKIGAGGCGIGILLAAIKEKYPNISLEGIEPYKEDLID